MQQKNCRQYIKDYVTDFLQSVVYNNCIDHRLLTNEPTRSYSKSRLYIVPYEPWSLMSSYNNH